MPARRLYGLQFHPEVVHTTRGREMLENFLFGVCGCERNWDPRHRVAMLEEQIRECVGDRNVFFFVSGGVDSTVAYTLCLRALGPERVRGVYVDTGLMREGETEFVQRTFEGLGGAVAMEHAEAQFLERAGRGARSGGQAADHRRGVRAGAGAHHRIAAPAGRALDSGAGHDLSGHDRIGRHGEGRDYQDAP